MANYIVQGDLDVLLSDADLQDLTDDDASGSIDSAIVTEAIVDAQAEVDGYLASRYTVPLTTIPETVKRWCVVLAVLRLYQRRRMEPTESFRDEVKDVRRVMRDLRDGKGSLEIGDDAPAASNSDPISVSSNTRRFSRSTMSGW